MFVSSQPSQTLYESLLLKPYSSIQHYFTLQTINNVGKKKCKFCPTTYSTQSASSNLTSHLQNKHSELFQSFEKQKTNNQRSSGQSDSESDRNEVDLTIDIPSATHSIFQTPQELSPLPVASLEKTFVARSPETSSSSSSSSYS